MSTHRSAIQGGIVMETQRSEALHVSGASEAPASSKRRLMSQCLWVWIGGLAAVALSCQAPPSDRGSGAQVVRASLSAAPTLSAEAGLDEPVETYATIGYPSVARGSTGSFAAWSDLRDGRQNVSGGRSEVFGARLDDAGHLLDPHGIRLTQFPDGGPFLVLFDGTRFVVFLQRGQVLRVRESDGELDTPNVGAPNIPWTPPMFRSFQAAATKSVTLVVSDALNFYGVRTSDFTPLWTRSYGRPEDNTIGPSRVLAAGTDGSDFLVVFDASEHLPPTHPGSLPGPGCHGVYAVRIRAADGAALDGPPTAPSCASPRVGTLLLDLGVGGATVGAVGSDGQQYLAVFPDSAQHLRGARIRGSDGVVQENSLGAGPLAIDVGIKDPQVSFDGVSFLVSSLASVAAVSPSDGAVRSVATFPVALRSQLYGADISRQIVHATPFAGGVRFAVTDGDNGPALMARQTSEGNTVDDPAVRVSASSNAELSPIASSDGTGFLVAWMDNRPINADQAQRGWAMRLDPDGKTLDPSGIDFSARGDPFYAKLSVLSTQVASSRTGSLIAWQVDFTHVFFTRVSSVDGSVTDDTDDPQTVITFADGMSALTSDGTNYLAAGFSSNGPWVVRIDGTTGRPLDSSKIFLSSPGSGEMRALSYAAGHYMVAWVSDGGLHIARIRAADGTLQGSWPIPLTREELNMSAMASDGENFLVVGTRTKNPYTLGESPYELVGVRIRGSDGTVLDSSPVFVSEVMSRDARLVFDGQNYVVAAWKPNLDFGVTRLRPADLAVLDPGQDGGGLPGPFGDVITSFEAPSLASDGRGATLITYSKYLAGPVFGSDRVFGRILREPTTAETPHETRVSYTGDLSGVFGGTVRLAGSLADADGPMPGQTLRFDLGAETCTAVTDSTGQAACSVPNWLGPGVHPITVALPGTPDLLGSIATASFTLLVEPSLIDLVGTALVERGSSATVVGRLHEAGGAIPNRDLIFAWGSGPDAPTCLATTDSEGRASCEIATADERVGLVPISVTFAGDVFYGPSTASGTAIVYGLTTGGTFVIDAANAKVGRQVSLGWEWKKTSPEDPRTFSGFAAGVSASCGAEWSTHVGDRDDHARAVPAYVAVIASSAVTRNRNEIAGDVSSVVIVELSEREPRRSRGSCLPGTVVAVLCEGAPAAGP